MQLLDNKASARQRKRDSRQVVQRIIITGTLVLESPTHLGNGDAEGLTDLPLLLDSADTLPVPLLQGTSIAGALRGYLQARQHGYFINEIDQEYEVHEPTPAKRRAESDQRKRTHDAVLLFGGAKGDEYGDQSPLIVDDALGKLPAEGIEVRDGVRIDGVTRTAEDKLKYDLELLPAGSTFPLRFELLIGADDDEQRLFQTLALALAAFEQGEITLGARKSRGFGRCKVREWTVTRYDLLQRDQLLAWLTADHVDWGYPTPTARTGKAADVLSAPPAGLGKQHTFTIVAEFELDSPLLIRSEEPLDAGSGNQPDFIHLRNSNHQPILPGTSTAGALRARATRIVNTLQLTNAQTLIDSLFGKDMLTSQHNPTASRLIVEESEIEHSATVVQNRVAIDRFTGGAFDTALFAEAPIIRGDVQLTLTVRNPTPADKGLMLLLLKDLWTSDLPLGGTSSIGRGRLRGIRATITARGGAEPPDPWTIEQAGERLIVSGKQQALEDLVKALHGGAV